MNFKEQDLVLIRLNNEPKYTGRQRHYNVWLRVEFKDNNRTFYGRVERKDDDYELHKINDIIHIKNSKVLDVFDKNDKKQWCYSDKVTRCNCPSVCRNK